MGFVKAAAQRIFFMCDGYIVEESTPDNLTLDACTEERTRQFLSKILI
jgi:ABC-type polar amino acid transport system ATPase subunit